MKSRKSKYLNWFVPLSSIILAITIYIVVGLLDNGKSAKSLKNDYTQLHSVEYGLFNSTVWANKIAEIVNQKIDEFNFTTTSREEIKKYIETILDTLIVEADNAIRKKNKKKKSFFDNILGSTKQMVTDSLIDMKDLRRKVPEFTDTVMNELEKPENQNILKAVLKEKLHQLMDTNLAQGNLEVFHKILKKYDTTDYKSCEIIIENKIYEIKDKMNKDMKYALTLVLILSILVLLRRSQFNFYSIFILSASSITMLIPGVMLPMIDIEAKISKLVFIILDKKLIFENQILFFQSKSISDLINLLWLSNEGKMIFVGILLATFSIIFPVLKLFSIYIYYYGKGFISNNSIVRFFALKSSKWSMADVMVVSIFMAYLGLDGVLNSELKKLEEKSEPINIITTNGTHLEVGFFLFLAFVAVSFLLSTLVEKYKTTSKDI